MAKQQLKPVIDEDVDEVEAILDRLSLHDWSYSQKFTDSLCSPLSSFCFLCLHLFLYFSFILVHILVWILGIALGRREWVYNPHQGFKDYLALYIMNEIETLSLQSRPSRGFIWNVRYYIITFIDGVNAFVLVSSGDTVQKVNHYRHRLALKNKQLGAKAKGDGGGGGETTFIGSDGGILCTDYDFAVSRYTDSRQVHQYATRYEMHPVVLAWCPLYSLGQTVGTRTHNFVRDVYYKVDSYLLDNFVKHRVPNDFYLPQLDARSGGVSMDDCFDFTISTVYYKLFAKELSAEHRGIFSKARAGLVSVGVIPNSLIDVIGDKMMARRCWTMFLTLRQLMLSEFRNHYIVRILIETGIRYGFTQDEELDYAINSFSVELLVRLAGLASVLQTALKTLSTSKDDANLRQFQNDPENYVLEALRFAGVPSSGRTVLNEPETIELNGKRVTLESGQSIIHAFDVLNRCPHMFPNGDAFDPTRENLKKDLFIFGNKEEFIRNKSATRSCPLHNFVIVQLQELIARLHNLKGLELRLMDRRFADSFELQLHGDNVGMKPVVKRVRNLAAGAVHMSLTPYNKYIIPPLYRGVADWNQNPPINVPSPFHPNDTAKPKELRKEILATVYRLPILDFALERSFVKDTLLEIFAIEKVFPVKDDPTPFRSNEEMLNWQRANVIVPKLNVDWKELVSDGAMSLFAFASIACLSTKRIASTQATRQKKRQKKGYYVPKNAAFVNDWRILNQFPVRKGLESYGATAFFDDAYNIISIYVSCLDRVIGRHDKLWQFAKYVWKTNVFVGVTVIDHAGWVHVTEANSLVTATREELPGCHPFRRLFDIFTYRSIYINLGVKRSLLSDNMLITRVSGFTNEAIQSAMKAVYGLYEFKPLHERVDASMADVPDDVFPINHDAKEMYNSMHYLVANYLNIYYADEAAFVADKYIQAFYAKLVKMLKLKDALSRLSIESFTYVAAGLMTSVTAYHELVGSVMDIAAHNVNWLDTKIYTNRFEKLQQSKNDFALTSVVVMLTGLKNPSILTDFSHVLIKDKHEKSAKRLFADWQKKLHDLANDIDARNQRKNRRMPFNACNPRHLECSVSI